MTVLNMSKYIAYFFLGIVALVLLTIMLALSPIGVSTLVNVANKQAGIAIENVSGSFYSEVKLGSFVYDSPQLHLIGNQIRLDIGLNCLFEAKACIDEFGARNIDITLKESNEVEEASVPLTEYIELPVAASLEKFAIAKLNIYTKAIKEERQALAVLSKINAEISMFKVLNVKTLSVGEANVFLPRETQESAVNDLVSEHWITQLKEYEFQAIAIPTIFVPINADIKKVSLAKLCIQQAQAICTLSTQINASIRQQMLKASIETKPAKQIAASIDVNASVNFAKAFTHNITLSVLPNPSLTSKEAQTLVFKANGLLTSTEVVLSSGTRMNNIVKLNAKANIDQRTLPLSVEVSASNYLPVLRAWLPDVELPVSAINAKIDGDVDSYNVAATVNVVSEQASNISLVGQLSISNKRLALSELKTSGDLGKLNARIIANITEFDGLDGVNIDSSIGFNNVQLKPLVPSVDSQLNGSLSLKASVTPSQLWGSLNCSDIKGKLQGFNLAFVCDVRVDKKGLVKINSLVLSQGKNRIVGKGQFELPNGLNTSVLRSVPTDSTINQWVNNTNSALDLTVNISDLSSLYSSATGTIKGRAKIIGKIDKPKVNAEFTVDKLVFNELKLNSAKIDVALDISKDWQTSITLSANELWQKSLLAQQFDLSITGNLSSHKLQLNLQHPIYSLSHELGGEVIIKDQKWRWLGMWNKGLFTSAFDSLTLEKPTSIRANKTSASIKQHCWLSTQMLSTTGQTDLGNKALCIEKAQYSATLTEVSASLAYNVNIPLLHYFPEIIKPGSSLPLKTEIDLAYSPDKGVQLDTYSLMTQANINTAKHNIELVALVANSSLRDQIVKTNIFAGTKSTGAIGLRSVLQLDPENRTHKGQFQIDNLVLSPLQRFLPSVEKLVGIVVGNISFDGLLVEPELNGELFINDVELVIDNYPYPITNFNQKITIANKKAEIEGELELGAGTADYTGTLTMFGDDQLFDFEGELIGAGMQLAFGKNEVLASPSLKIAVNPKKFSLKGEVTIPNAQISIEKLPQSAKSPSSDTIIIGKPADPPIIPIALDINVRVLLDPPKLRRVTIKALDLEASLGGDLRVQVIQKQDPITQEFSPLETYVYGSINVLRGSYEAYGQNLQIRNGAIFFNGAPSLPQFDITAVRNPLNTADNVVAGLRISGNPVMPKVELFSQPSMIQARQLSYLILGTDIDGGKGTANDVFLVNALVNFGVGNSENGINKFGQSIGFDTLNLQTAGQGVNTQVQLTGRISDNIQVTYGVGLFDQASEVILRYQLMPQLYLEAKSGATSAVDLFYEWTRGE